MRKWRGRRPMQREGCSPELRLQSDGSRLLRVGSSSTKKRNFEQVQPKKML